MIMTFPIDTDAYSAAIDALGVDPADIPKTIRAAVAQLRGAVAGLAQADTGWRYHQMTNWPHAGYVAAGPTPIADVHAAAGAGPYLALMGPQLGQALADWLEAAAQREEAYQADIPVEDRGEASPDEGDEAFAALVIAHTILTISAGEVGK